MHAYILLWIYIFLLWQGLYCVVDFQMLASWNQRENLTFQNPMKKTDFQMTVLISETNSAIKNCSSTCQ